MTDQARLTETLAPGLQLRVVPGVCPASSDVPNRPYLRPVALRGRRGEREAEGVLINNPARKVRFAPISGLQMLSASAPLRERVDPTENRGACWDETAVALGFVKSSAALQPLPCIITADLVGIPSIDSIFLRLRPSDM
jgi:hypothetical protein